MIKGFKTINLLLILITIVAGGWLVNIWSDPVEIPTLKGVEIKTPPEVATEAVIPLPFHYNVIVNKNLFRSSRKRYVAKVKPPLPPPPPAPTPAPPPPPKRPIPKFSLYGTIILKDKDDMAIISTNMQNRKPVTYHNGDEIEEGFVLKEIHSNKVVLERAEDKEVVEVSFKAPSLSTARPGTRSPASRPRPPMRRRENRRNNLGTPVMPFPEPIPPPQYPAWDYHSYHRNFQDHKAKQRIQTRYLEVPVPQPFCLMKSRLSLIKQRLLNLPTTQKMVLQIQTTAMIHPPHLLLIHRVKLHKEETETSPHHLRKGLLKRCRLPSRQIETQVVRFRVHSWLPSRSITLNREPRNCEPE